MYFIPQRTAWYRSVVHIKPPYRYGITVIFFLVMIIGWRFGLYAWLDSIIAQDQKLIAQLTQQSIQLVRAEKTCTTLSCSLGEMRKKLEPYAQRCTGEFCQNQLITLIDEAQKAGVMVTSYGNQKEIQKNWCVCKEIQIGLAGSLDNITHLFQALKKSRAMIQCNQISCNRVDTSTFNATCAMRFITL